MLESASNGIDSLPNYSLTGDNSVASAEEYAPAVAAVPQKVY
jgi:hypothetical protein